MIENKVSSLVEDSGRGFLCLVAAGFLASQIFSYFALEAVLYGACVLVGIVYVFRRPGEGIWVTFFLLAITCLLYPITVSELGEPGVGDFRPYNVVIASIAVALIVSAWRRRRLLPPSPPRRQAGTLELAFVLAGVFCLATIYGDLSPLRAEALYVLQQCSTWISFFLFLWLGYKLALSPAEIRPALRRFHSTSLIYCIVFLVKFVYMNYYAGFIAATEFAYAQRMVLLFAGCSLALTVASMLAPERRSPRKSGWLSVLISLPAVVLSGSRGVTGAVIFTVLVLAATWRSRSLLRLTPLFLATLLVGVWILQSHSQVAEEYIVDRFLITPDQDASLGGRVAEMEAVIEAVQRNPLLGSGTLASYTFFDPFFGWRESAFVDSGVGYLLLKTGLLGASVFILLVLSYLKVLRHLRRSDAADALIPLVVFVFYLAFLPFGPAFFDPRSSWLIGILCGYSLYLNKIHNEKTNLCAPEMGADGNPGSRSYA